MRAAVIGAGQWGQNLVATLHALYALAVVVEADPARRLALTERYPGLVVTDALERVLEGDVDAVAIATPAPTHYDLARAALLAGKDVFVEKPMTISSAEAEDLAAVAEARSRVLMVGHLLLYQPAVRFLKGYLEAGRLGRVYALHQERLNLGRVRSVENVLWSFGVHDVAVLLHLVGQGPERLTVTGQCILQPGIEDDVRLDLSFAHGVRASLHTSWLWPEKRRRLTVLGEAGMLVFDELAQTVTLHRKTVDAGLSARDEGQEVLFAGNEPPLSLELSHFLACLRDRQAPISDGWSAVEVIRVLETATQRLEDRYDHVPRPSDRLPR